MPKNNPNWTRRLRLLLMLCSAAILLLTFGPSGAAFGIFANQTAIAIPAGGSDGPANPYPSVITVDNLPGLIIDVKVQLRGLTHGAPADLDILVIGPTGSTALVASDACAGTVVNGVTWTLSAVAAQPLPSAGACPSGSYQPANYDGSDGDNLPLPAPGGPYGSALSVFNGTNANGVWQILVFDDQAGSTGLLGQGWALEITTAPALIAVPGTGTSGIANPYPTLLNVSGQGGLIADVNANISGVTHPFADDLDLLLVGPTGQSVLLVSDACGSPDLVDVNWTISDEAVTLLPDTGPCVAGSFRPSNYPGDSDVFPAPAPAGPYGTALSGFDGLSPNGLWQLYAVDDTPGSAGFIVDGFSVQFVTQPSAITVPGAGSTGIANPYPATVDVTGRTGTITDVDVVVNGVTHSRPDDLDMLVVSPGGQAAVLASDACGESDIVNRTWTFDDEAALPLPDATLCSSGSFRPADYEPGENYPFPAPLGTHSANLAVFDGIDPNGTWQLFIVDDLVNETGFVVTDWQVNITTTTGGGGAGTRVGLYNPANALWLLRNDLTTGEADTAFVYGGVPNGIGLAGDWNSDNIDSPGIYVPDLAFWFLRNSNTTGEGEIFIVYGGIAGALPVVGDWDGDGADGIGLYIPATGQWLLRDSLTTGGAQISFLFGGIAGALPIAGDWNGDGIDTIGLYNPATAQWLLRNSNATGDADVSLLYGGIAGGVPVVGDWDNNNSDTVGIYVPDLAFWFLRNSNTTGEGESFLVYGGIQGATPVTGAWMGSGPIMVSGANVAASLTQTNRANGSSGSIAAPAAELAPHLLAVPTLAPAVAPVLAQAAPSIDVVPPELNLLNPSAPLIAPTAVPGGQLLEQAPAELGDALIGP
ncbi:MAG: hypothetical protein GYB67_16630 [Chloroflexi bacterium]|nr:hypothetical protein [Chloroflexota bacterium]